MFVIRLLQWPFLIGIVGAAATMLSVALVTWWNTWEYVNGVAY
jgi:hypothetical protein